MSLRILVTAFASAITLGSAIGGPALASPLACDTTTPSECVITIFHSVSGPVEVDRTLHIKGPAGELRVPAGGSLTLAVAGGPTDGLIIETGGKITGNGSSGATLTITVASGNVLLAESGATISADATSGNGGVITITANGLNATIKTEDGTRISVNSPTTAGAINISAPNQGAIDIDGDVLSEGGKSGTGATQGPGGGPIFLTASCNLTVSDTGKVSSAGSDAGADLVHLQGGCDVLIQGLVQSTGPGHAVPNFPPNSCDDVAPANGSPPRRNLTTRPGKPSNSTACVEVWAGNSLTILRNIPGLNGEINADTGSGGGNQGTGWIDLFARGAIHIFSDANPAVHANGLGGSGGTGEVGGIVTVKSITSEVVASGFAIQASAFSGGADGGTVTVQGKLDVTLNSGALQADGATSGSTPAGGHIFVRSFQEDIQSNAASSLDVTGGQSPNGTIDLTACKTIGFPPGVILPNGLPAGNVTKSTPVCNVAGPSLPTEYVVVLPDCPCGNQPLPPPGGPGTCLKSTVTAVLNPTTGRFPGNKGPDMVVRVGPGFNEVIQTAVDALAPSGDLNNDGYIIILVVNKDDGLLGGNTTQRVEVSAQYTKPFALIGCSVTMHAPDGTLPTGHILASAGAPLPPLPAIGNIFVMDLHGADSVGAAGWQVDGDGRLFRNVYGIGNSVGLSFNGNGNTMTNGRAEQNSGDGIAVKGNTNTLDSPDSFNNGGNGVTVIGNGNILKKIDSGDRGKGNGGDGFHVEGNQNQIIEGSAFADGGYGFFVSGNANKLTKNDSGDLKKGNGLDGFRVQGNTNVLDSNRANANGGAGINITGPASTGNSLKNTVSNDSNPGDKKENAGPEYCFPNATTLDLGGNAKDKLNFVGVGSPKKYPSGCFE